MISSNIKRLVNDVAISRKHFLSKGDLEDEAYMAEYVGRYVKEELVKTRYGNDGLTDEEFDWCIDACLRYENLEPPEPLPPRTPYDSASLSNFNAGMKAAYIGPIRDQV